METLRDNGTTVLQLRYDDRRIRELVMAGGATYKFAFDYDSAERAKPRAVRLTHPDGRIENFSFGAQ